ncbi:MAG: aldehyde dehydrogenase family protein, partial [Bacteroidota bacterium]
HSMDLMKGESFGPVIGIQKVASDEEAISLMQDTEYGLTASVYADQWESAEPILAAMKTGTVYWNCCDRVSPYVPWAGRKKSGIGATLSHQGIRAFTHTKSFHLRG